MQDNGLIKSGAGAGASTNRFLPGAALAKRGRPAARRTKHTKSAREGDLEVSSHDVHGKRPIGTDPRGSSRQPKIQHAEARPTAPLVAAVSERAATATAVSRRRMSLPGSTGGRRPRPPYRQRVAVLIELDLWIAPVRAGHHAGQRACLREAGARPVAECSLYALTVVGVDQPERRSVTRRTDSHGQPGRVDTRCRARQGGLGCRSCCGRGAAPPRCRQASARRLRPCRRRRRPPAGQWPSRPPSTARLRGRSVPMRCRLPPSRGRRRPGGRDRGAAVDGDHRLRTCPGPGSSRRRRAERRAVAAAAATAQRRAPRRPSGGGAALAPTVTCGSACVWLMTWACAEARLPGGRAAACMPASSVQMTTAVPAGRSRRPRWDRRPACR